MARSAPRDRDGWLIGWATAVLLFVLALIAGIIIGPQL